MKKNLESEAQAKLHVPTARHVAHAGLVAQVGERRSSDTSLLVESDLGDTEDVLIPQATVVLTPMLVDEVADIENIEHQGELAATLLEIVEVLREVEVEMVFPGSGIAVALGILAAVVLGVLVVLNPILEAHLVLFAHIHVLELGLGRNVEQGVATAILTVVGS